MRSEKSENGSEESHLRLLIGEKSAALERKVDMMVLLERVGPGGKRAGSRATVVGRV